MESLAGIQIFKRVVEAGSFSAASRQLGVAPSSVSRQVSELEDVLGVRLFQRSTRKLSLTEAGEIYYQRAGSIIADVDEARLAVSQLDGTPTGILRLNVPGSLSRRHIVPAIAEFQRQYLAVEVVLLVSDQVLDMIEHRIDLTIRLGALSDSNLVARKLSSGRRLLCASPAYLSAQAPLKLPGDLIDHNCLTFRSNSGSNVWRFKSPEGTVSEVQASGRLVSNDGESLVAAAVAAQGVILVPEWLVRDEINNGELAAVLPGYSCVPRDTPMYALYPQQRHLAPKVRAFIDFMLAHLNHGEHPVAVL